MKPNEPFRVEGDLIYTSHVINADDALRRLVDSSGLGAFIGPAGAGKTYVITRLVQQFDALRVIWVEPTADPTQRQLAHQIADGMAGPVKLRTRFQLYGFLLNELKAAIKSGRVLLVVDEAQRLGHECIEDLRYLHDQVGKGFALALLGGKKCWDVIEGDLMLRSRVRRKTDMNYLKDADAIKMARIYHPIYQGVPNSLLIEINKACAGRFRTWFLFTDEAAALCRDLGRKRISKELVRETLQLMNGNPKKAKPRRRKKNQD